MKHWQILSISLRRRSIRLSLCELLCGLAWDNFHIVVDNYGIICGFLTNAVDRIFLSQCNPHEFSSKSTEFLIPETPITSGLEGVFPFSTPPKATDTEAFHRHNIYCAPRKEFYTHENCLHEK